MAIITIVGSGMMGSALAFPARENGHTVRLVGTHLDREIISACQKTNRHPKFTRDFPAGVEYYQIEALDEALAGADLVIGGVSSFGVEWFGENVLPRIADGTKVLTVTKGLQDTPDGKLIPYPYLWKEKVEALGLYRWFAPESIVVSGAVGVAKPDPEIFRIACERLGTSPESCVYVGDSFASDVVGATSAGMPVVWFNHRRREAPAGPGVPRPEWVVEDEQGLLALLKSLA